MADTAKNWTIDKAPKRLRLFGDKVKKVESAQHIIEFPGGAIELSRTTDGDYWAHILVNQDQFADGDGDGFTSAAGEVVASRLDCATGHVEDIPNEKAIRQVAVLIRTKGKAVRQRGH